MISRIVVELGDSFDDAGNRRRQITLKEPQLFGVGAYPFPVTGEEQAFRDMDGDGGAAVAVELPAGAAGAPGAPVAPAGAAAAVAAVAAGAIAAAGEFLFGTMLGHPTIREKVTGILNDPPDGGCPILVSLNAFGAEGFPFEAMFAPRADFPALDDSARFLALDPRWPIARMVPSSVVARLPGPFAPPLRIAAVLSALDISAQPEWEALRAAIEAPDSVPTELFVLASEPELIDLITLAAVPGVTVQPVPEDPDRLQSLISGFEPHVLHFFCHGTADGGGQLLIATKNDRERRDGLASVVFEDREVRGCASKAGDPPWLVLLNCCEGAATSGEGMTSLSLRLVQDSTFGAVIGMREPVLDVDAARFAQNFYLGLLADLRRRVDGAVSGPIRWPALAVPARRAVAATPGKSLSAAAALSKAWTLPVVFVRSTEFELTVRSALAPTGPVALGGPPVGPPPGVVIGGGPGLPPPPPPPPVPGPGAGPAVEAPAGANDPHRAALMEIDLLRGVLAQLPGGGPEALRTDILARLAELTRLVA